MWLEPRKLRMMAAVRPRFSRASKPRRITAVRRSMTRWSPAYMTELARRSMVADRAGSLARMFRIRSTLHRSSATAWPSDTTVVGRLGRVLTLVRTSSEVIMVRSPG